MAGVGGDGPGPTKDDGPDPMTGITIVHKVKSKLGYTEIHTPAPPMDEKGQELVAANPSQKNWKGICIAVGCIVLVLCSVALAVVIRTPKDLGPRYTGDRITINHILDPKYYPRHFNGSWISDTEIVFLDSKGGLSILDVTSLNQSQIVSNIVFRQFDVQSYKLSPSRKFVLFSHKKQRRYRYSSTAVYTIFEISNEHKWEVSAQDIDIDDFSSLESPRLQYATWLPSSAKSSHSGSAIVFVENYSIYYIPDVGKYEKREIFPISSSDEVTDAVIHGIPDWIYEEDILKRADAIWPSPDGNKLIYATFNDTEVQQVRWKVYEDTSDGNLDPYPKEKTMYYPKAGTKNPTISLWRVDFTDSRNLRSVQLKPPMLLKNVDHYFTSVSWSKSDGVAVIWMNRAQNLSIVTYCAPPSFLCKETYRENVAEKEWATLYQPPYYSKNGESYLLIAPQRDGKNGKYLHIIKVERDSKPNTSILEHPITLGPFEVKNILAWDESNNIIYFQGIPADNSSSRHIYSVKDDSASVGTSKDSINPPICLTCNLPEAITNYNQCTFSEATFSSSLAYFVLQCLGPDVPSSYLVSTVTSQRPTDPKTDKDADNNKGGDAKEIKTALKLVHVLDLNNDTKENVKALAWPNIEIDENVTLPNGRKVRTKLYLPPELRKNEITKYPMVVHVYGGPGSQLVINKWKMEFNHVLASGKSYIVLEVDGAGTGGQGEANKMLLKHKLGQREVQDQLDTIKYMIETYKFIDETRIAASGVSYGGYVVGMMLAKSKEDGMAPIHCGVAISPVVEWRYYESAYTERYMGIPSEDTFSWYEEGSLIRKAHQLYGKSKDFLLAHGMADTNVHLQNSMVLAKELVKYNVTFQQQFYPNEGHNLGGVKLHLFNTVLKFLHQCLEPSSSHGNAT